MLTVVAVVFGLAGTAAAVTLASNVALAPPMDFFRDGAPAGSNPILFPTYATAGGYFPDGTALVGTSDVVAHYTDDLSALLDVFAVTQAKHMLPHPDGALVVASDSDDTVYKFTSSGTGLVLSASDSDAGDCDRPYRLAIQQTGNQRIFAACYFAAFCQYNSDLSGRTCRPATDIGGLAVAPDDSFLVVRDLGNLQKYTIDDAGGTLSGPVTLDVSGSIGSTNFIHTIAILSDLRIVITDQANDQLEVIDPTFTTVTTITVLDGSPFSGVTPTCEGPREIVVDPAGVGDLVVGCEGSLLVLSNDLSTTALNLVPADLGLLDSIAFTSDVTHAYITRASSDKVFVGSGFDSSYAFFFLDMGGGGSSGLAGSYGTPVLAPPATSHPDTRAALSSGTAVAMLNTAGAAVFGDGTVLVPIRPTQLGHFSFDLSSLLGTDPNGGAVFPHSDGAAFVLDAPTDTIFKYTSSGSTLTQVASDLNAECTQPHQAASQHGGNQRVFVACLAPTMCQYNSDLSGRSCFPMTVFSASVAVAPNDMFLFVRDFADVRKYTIDDAAGTLTLDGTLASGAAGFLTSIAVLADFRVVVPSAVDALKVIDSDFSTVSTINVNDGSTLGGITPACGGSKIVVTDSSGIGDVVVICDDSDTLLVISNDLSSTAIEFAPRLVPGSDRPTLGSSMTARGIFLASPSQLAVCANGVALFDLTGGGSAGLAGSYDSPVAGLQDRLSNVFGTIVGPKSPPIEYPKGFVDFGDGTMAVAMGFTLEHLILTSTDFETVYDQVQLDDDVGQMVGHPDGSALVLVQSSDSVFKFASTGSALVQVATDSDAGDCDFPVRLVVQQTGNQRIFVACSTSQSLCQYNADLSGRTCTAVSTIRAVAISPDDTSLFARAPGTLYKFGVDDGAGTLTLTDTLDVSSFSNTAIPYDIVVLADGRVVIPDTPNDQLEVVNAAFDTVTTINVNDGSTLGGITPACVGPEGLAVATMGAGDVVVACDTSDSLLVLSNDLGTSAVEITGRDFHYPAAAEFSVDTTGPGVGQVGRPTGSTIFWAGNTFFALFEDALSQPATESASETQTQTQTQTHSESATQSMTPSQSQTASATESAAPPGSVGDPILVDFSGHRFLGGARGRTEYLLYRSHDETEAITMTTGVVQGAEQGFFAVAVDVQRAGCGSLRVAAIEAEKHAAEISGDACMEARIARGDSGLVLVPIGAGGDAGSVLAVYPHHQGDSPAFLNMRLLATTPAFRAGCTGMLCNEAHGDVEA